MVHNLPNRLCKESYMRYSGRDFTEKELAWIRQLIEDRPEISRKDISSSLLPKSWLV